MSLLNVAEIIVFTLRPCTNMSVVTAYSFVVFMLIGNSLYLDVLSTTLILVAYALCVVHRSRCEVRGCSQEEQPHVQGVVAA